MVMAALDEDVPKRIFCAELPRRTSRWRSPHTSAEFLLERAKCASKVVRFRVLGAVIWAWFNAWATKCRYGMEEKSCWFCGMQDGERRDDILHFADCKVLRRAARFAFPTLSGLVRDLMLVVRPGLAPEEEVAVWATVSFSIRAAHGHVRRGGAR